MNREEARQNFQSVTRGKRRTTHVELEEAKARLRRVDEALDISPALNYLGKGDWQAALIALVPLAIDEIKLDALFLPLVTRGLPYLFQFIFTSKKTANQSGNKK